MAWRLNDLAQLHVHALDGVGRGDLPGPLPGRDDRSVLGPPGPIGERLKRRLGRLCAGGSADRAQRGGRGLAILPPRVIQPVADQIHDADLHRRAREGRADGVGQALQVVDHGNQDVLAPSGLAFIEDLEPELRPLGLLDPQAQHVALAVGLHAQRQIHRLVADPRRRRGS